MKKTLFVILLLFNFFILTSFKAQSETNNIYIHYFRYDNNYDNWGIWLWEHEPESKEGMDIGFIKDDTLSSYNYGGVVAKISLDDFLNTTTFGFIVKTPSWEKDIDEDRYFSVTNKNSDGNVHIYVVEGEREFGYSIDDPDGPSKGHKFIRAYFIEENQISFTTTSPINENDLKLFVNDVLTSYNKIIFNNEKEGTITLNNNIDFNNTYKLEVYFEADKQTNSKEVSIEGLYDTDSFNDKYYYDGELGAIYETEKTTFKLWAPLASKVTLDIFETGTPENLGGTNNPTNTYELSMGDKGVYSIEVLGDLHGKYYTYNVTNKGVTHKNIVDPYALSVGINGLRGLVVDFNKTNPEGWEYNKRANNIAKTSEDIIYELHVRDLTTHETWNGTEENRGMFLGLIEEGTKYNNITTGFDHIKEIGITHLQILPFFDYGNAIDESRQKDDNYNSFNWGYMPLNFNALEGNYSSDPYDGLKRIEEFKKVVMAYTEANIRINMDVVYNHTGQSADSNFNLIVPGYYHRFDKNGGYSNGSGTGNETASERLMVRKFIVDSTKFWLEEYNLGGFRFDLMALHDLDTMIEVNHMAKEIDPTIMIYGEPWHAENTALDESLQSGKDNLIKLEDIGAFNDDTRDGLKGSVFSSWMGGYLQGDYANLKKVKYGIVGGIKHVDNANYNVWHGTPNKTLNYVSAHDNNTLHDKLYLTLEEENNLDLITPLSMQAYGIILTSQGIPFLHAGDDFLRSKEISEGKFDDNSYQSPDEINWINWSLKEKNQKNYDFVKNLIEIRKQNDVFTSNNNDYINENLRFLEYDIDGLIIYTLKDLENNSTYLLVLNSTNSKYSYEIASDNWNLLETSINIDYPKNIEELLIEKHSFYLLKTNSIIDISKYQSSPKQIKSKLGLILIISSSALLIAGGLTTTFLIISKRKQK